MGVVRSTHRGPVQALSRRDDDNEYEDQDEDEWYWWGEPLPEVLDYEESLPDQSDDDSDGDEYEDQWYQGSRSLDAVDDSPAWVTDFCVSCARCGQQDDVDPLGTCTQCREDDRRCSWCGLDPTVYESSSACRTCYQRLRRTRVTNDLSLRLSMLEAAFRRAELRKRREASV
ncbi:MAG: hypothetical protein M3082_18140 [Candidatus Dormibacteraeota bacterium]|nr:hypothetical protein [Candidatus Dormibacteraeota bacterium]